MQTFTFNFQCYNINLKKKVIGRCQIQHCGEKKSPGKVRLHSLLKDKLMCVHYKQNHHYHLTYTNTHTAMWSINSEFVPLIKKKM